MCFWLFLLFLQAVNELLESLGAPLEMVDGFVSSIAVTIPWQALLTDHCTLEVSGLQITCRPKYRTSEFCEKQRPLSNYRLPCFGCSVSFSISLKFSNKVNTFAFAYFSFSWKWSQPNCYGSQFFVMSQRNWDFFQPCGSNNTLTVCWSTRYSRLPQFPSFDVVFLFCLIHRFAEAHSQRPVWGQVKQHNRKITQTTTIILSRHVLFHCVYFEK